MVMLSHVMVDGEPRKLGNILRENRLCVKFARYGDTPETPLIPRSEWVDRIKAIGEGPESPFLPPVHDQNGVGQCNPECATATVEYQRAQQGLPYEELCAPDLYDRINGGGDNGSMLEDALAELLANGVGTMKTCGIKHWKRGMRTAPAEERARFKYREVYVAPTFDHYFSGILMGFSGNTGILWYDNYKPDIDGWLPTGQGNYGGHSIMGYKPTFRNGQFGVWHQNSWGESWGVRGRMVVAESAYRGPVGGWYLVRGVIDEGNVVPVA